MDARLREKAPRIHLARQRADTTAIWRVWCKAIEDAASDLLQHDFKQRKAMAGRGTVRIQNQKVEADGPVKRNMEDTHSRGLHRQADAYTGQSRRLQHIIARSAKAGTQEHMDQRQIVQLRTHATEMDATDGLRKTVGLV